MCVIICSVILMSRYEQGDIIRGTITAIETYGAFVSCDEYYNGLIHISEITDGFVKNVGDYLQIGEIVYCKILDIDEVNGHLKLSVRKNEDNKKKKFRRSKIIETSKGFKTLAYNLPFWIEERLKKGNYSDLK